MKDKQQLTKERRKKGNGNEIEIEAAERDKLNSSMFM